MARVQDVAAYILQKQGPMSAMKLQKLAYYAQAWSLVWDERPLFKSDIQAWANGPVCPELFQLHRGRYQVGQRDIPGDTNQLEKDERETIDAILQTYGNKEPQWLSDLTHGEAPWREARYGVADGAFCDRVISLGSMYEYYASL